MTDMREKVAQAMEAVQVHVGGHEVYVVRDAALTLEEVAALAQAAITTMWPLAMEDAAKVATGSPVSWMPVQIAAAIRNRKAPL
jgi:hypothetical protein